MTTFSPVTSEGLQWQPYREPLGVTVLRTGLIALIVGTVVAISRGSWRVWPIATLLVLWPSFGGHWVEIFFVNWLRLRIPSSRAVQIFTRLAVWFVGGLILAAGMALTAMALTSFRPAHWPAWWIAGVGFIAVELVAHVFLQLRGRPSFYNGRG
jgi:hypothetical protein